MCYRKLNIDFLYSHTSCSKYLISTTVKSVVITLETRMESRLQKSSKGEFLAKTESYFKNFLWRLGRLAQWTHALSEAAIKIPSPGTRQAISLASLGGPFKKFLCNCTNYVCPSLKCAGQVPVHQCAEVEECQTCKDRSHWVL